MASGEGRGSFCRYDSCVITDQLATGPGALERELLPKNPNTLIAPPLPEGTLRVFSRPAFCPA